MHEASGCLYLVQLRFKVHRGLVAEGAVEPLPVVKDFNPFKDRSSGFGPRSKLAAMHEFLLQAAPEAFHRRVIIAVALSAHAGNHAPLRQTGPVGAAGILHPAIGVMHQAGLEPALFQGHVQRGQWERGARESLITQPTHRRVHRSITPATYNQPSAVST